MITGGRGGRDLIFLFFLDWLGSITLLAAAGVARSALGTIPDWLAGALNVFSVPFAPTWVDVPLLHMLPLRVFGLVALVWPVFLLSAPLYRASSRRRLRAELAVLLQAISVATLVLLGAVYLIARDTPRLVLVIFYILDVCALLGLRVFLASLRRFDLGGGARTRVLVVGAGSVGRQIEADLRSFSASGMEVVAFVDDAENLQGETVEGIPVAGTLDDIESVAESFSVADAVIALPLRAYRRIADASSRLQRQSVRVHIVPDIFALSFPGSHLEGFGGVPMICLSRVRFTFVQRLTKRTFDLTVGLAVLVIASPIMLACAVAIRLSSRGSVFFRQERVGEDGRPFVMYKFRTMYDAAPSNVHAEHVINLIRYNVAPEDLGESSIKLKGDGRVTAVGRFLRRLSLDEMPQLFNVMRGEMSLIGPRPAMAYEVEHYENWHRQRLEAPPGMTGLWQVRARNKVSFDEMVRLDIEYIEKFSLARDVWILARTPVAMVSGLGAG